MKKRRFDTFELIFRSSLLLHIMYEGKIIGIGSGVIVTYKGRYFLCTAEHLLEGNKNSIAIQIGVQTEKGIEMLIFNDFSFLSQIKLGGKTEEALLLAIESFEGTKALDVAILEVSQLNHLTQEQILIPINKKTLEISFGTKCIISVDGTYLLNKKSLFTFAGMINSKQKQGERHIILPKLTSDMKVSNIYSFLIEFNLGHPIKSHSLFKGCSGAPIFDNDNNLVAILTGGSEDVSKPFVYGFRFDVIKNFIDMLYFNGSLDKALANKPF